MKGVFLRNSNIDPCSQSRQLELMNKINAAHLAERGPDEMPAARIEALETAFRIQFEATDAFYGRIYSTA